MQQASLAAQRQRWWVGRPSWEDIHASATTDNTRQVHWPFRVPRPDSYPTTPAEDAVGYTQILQELSRTLLEVVE